MKGGEVIYYQDGGFDQERFEAFVRGNRGEFEEKKEEVQGAEETEVKEQEVITADGTAKEETSNAKILDVEIDENGVTYTLQMIKKCEYIGSFFGFRLVLVSF